MSVSIQTCTPRVRASSAICTAGGQLVWDDITMSRRSLPALKLVRRPIAHRLDIPGGTALCHSGAGFSFGDQFLWAQGDGVGVFAGER